MKKIVLISSVVCLTIFATIFIACNKSANTKVSNNSSAELRKGSELTFFAKDAKQAEEMVLNFLDHSKHNPKKTKQTRESSFGNVNNQIAAWLVEASSNYLENRKGIRVTSTASTNLEINKVNADEVSGADLTAKFDAFITGIESNPSNPPLLINVSMLENTIEHIVIKIDVGYGPDGPIPALTYPTMDMNYIAAAEWLESNFYTENVLKVYNDNLVVNGNQLVSGYNLFWYNLTFTSPLCISTPTLSTPWLWASQVANGTPLDPIFKVTDFPIYLTALMNQVPNDNAVNGSFGGNNNLMVLNYYLEGQEIINKMGVFTCSNPDAINGFVHCSSAVEMGNYGLITY